VGGLFSLEIISFVEQNSFMKSHLFILSLSCWAAQVLLRKSFPIPIGSRVFPSTSCSNFRVSGLIPVFIVFMILTGCWWFIPVILTTWVAEVGRITVQGHPGQIVQETPSPKNSQSKMD
jgi:hypothetical protein